MLEDVVKYSKPLALGTKILIFGGGYSGQHIAKVARKLGATVICSRRDIKKIGADFEFDSENKALISENVFEGVTHIISSIPPNKLGKDPVILRFGKILQTLPLQWVGYLSTTGVYGDYQGGWVSENSITYPKQTRSINRLSCEKEWQSLNLPLQILRLPGIYGPGRSALEALKANKDFMVHKPGQVFSRIHIDDIAGSIMYLINLFCNKETPRIINIADDNPANNIEVLTFASNLLNIPIPSVKSFDLASKDMSPIAKSFWQENRKVSNKTLCNILGYNLIHADYKSGLNDCFKSFIK